MKVLLKRNDGYKWSTKGGISFKGYFQYQDDKSFQVYRENKALSELSSISNFENFFKFLGRIDGVFSVIIEREEEVWAAVDVSRSMPLFYSKECGYISDSAEAIREALYISKDDVDMDRYIELLDNDFVFGDNTIYKEIKQLDLGQVLFSSNNQIVIKYYFYHIAEVEKDITVDEAIGKIKEASFKDFIALKEVINGRPVVISLSGGYDSRFVATMLKEVGITDVSCYTYGKSDSFEVIQSKKNAEALGFRWICVEHTDDIMEGANDSVGQEYMDSYTNHDFTAYLQNFPSVRKLHETGWIKPGSVFITGLCGDMPTGEYLEKEIEGKEYSIRTAVDKLYELIVFHRYNLPTSFEIKWKNWMKAYLGEIPIVINDYQTWVTAVDCLYTMSCHPHWFMNMNTVHSFFGYEWLLPYWNRNLLKVWYSMPAFMKVDQKLYESFLLDHICSKYGINQRKYQATYSRNKFKREIMYRIGAIIVWLFFHMGKPFKNKYDYNNFAPFDYSLYKNLSCKETVLWKKAGTQHLINQRCLQKRYGVDVMKKALSIIKNR